MATHRLFLSMAAFALLCVVAIGEGDWVTPFWPSCSTSGNYTEGSQYQKNLAELLPELLLAAGLNGWFYKDSAGTGADQVFGLIMCFADRDETQCQECLAFAPTEITWVCPGSRNVSAAYEACVLLYSDARIPTTADRGNAFYVNMPGARVNSEGLRAAWVPLMSKLMGGAAASPLRLANGSTPYSSSQEMYGLAQCTRDLNGTECTRCIGNYIGQLEGLFPNSTGGYIKGYSCYLRYQVGAFNISLSPAPLPSPQPAPGPSSSSNTGLVIGISVGSISFLIILGFSTCLLLRRRRKQSKILEEAMEQELENGGFCDDDEFEKRTGPKRFRYGELAIATDNFADDRKLGEGGFGSVYRGFLKEMNLEVDIKRVSKGSKQGRKDYASEVRIISRLRHRNLVQLIGWCHGGGELLLVYELMPNGSLDRHLYSSASDGALLPWPRRHEIVLGLGSALLYLHEEWEQCVVHRDIKPSNVMLDASFNVKLGDFGLARLVDHGRGSHTTELAGTTGYMDPECTVTGRFSTGSDMYCFGVLLLEVACGRRPVVVLPDDAVIHLAQRLSELHGRGMVLHAADPRLNGEFDAKEMECVLVVGLWCTQQDWSMRPSIRQAVSALRFEAPLPSLPARLPVAATTYAPSPGSLLNSVPSLLVADSTRTGTMYLSTTTS